jgi:hypothetical protein
MRKRSSLQRIALVRLWPLDEKRWGKQPVTEEEMAQRFTELGLFGKLPSLRALGDLGSLCHLVFTLC